MTHAVFHLSRVLAPRALLNDNYGAHRTFWRAFGLTEDTLGQVQPFRFREECGSQAMNPVASFMVQSAQEPRWEEVLGLRAEVKSVEVPVDDGMLFYFRLRACVERTVTEGERKRKLAILDPRAIEAWLYRKGEAHGFEPTEFVFTKPELAAHRAKVKGGDGHHAFVLGDVQFDGQLRVTNAERFAKAIVDGVGPKAAFGFGMLSVSR